jgi:hypothetical protein
MPAKWTFMVYMAGNNSLSGAASIDLGEMQKVGSSDAVQVLAFVKQASGPARYIRVGRGGHDEVHPLPPSTDSGDPQTVVDFVRWAIKGAPAERYALVLWNHGGGWSPDDFDELYKQVRGVRAKAESNRLGAKKLARTLFKKSIRTVLALPTAEERAICCDDVTGHSLDTLEVEDILATVHRETGKPLELFGMDACLMSTIEVAYQVRKHAATVVGSEATEPGPGWCYDAILRDLAASPDLDGKGLGRSVVTRYIESYKNDRGDWPVTQCALDTGRLEGLGKAIDRLANALRETLPAGWPKIHRARTQSANFEFDMVDLRSLCRALIAGAVPEDLKAAAAAVVETFTRDRYVVAEGHLGDKVRDCGGVSIYLPAPMGGPLSKYYADLRFAKEHGWDRFLAQYLGSVGA